MGPEDEAEGDAIGILCEFAAARIRIGNSGQEKIRATD
jgi:hypothetical protein